MSDLNTEIKIGADASGVEAGVGKAKRSLKDLGDAAQKAGKDAGAGIGSIGAGGDKAAKDVERATKSMQGSLQRLLAEQKAGAKGSREYYEALADTRGISRNAIKPILDQIDAAKAKTLQAKTAADSWTASLGKVAPLVAAAFSGAAITGFLGKVVSVQREFDVLNSSLKTVTGSSAAAEREMAWLKDFAKETPFGLAQATQGFVKMKALGLDPTRAALTSFGNTASAMGKDLNQMIEAVADASTGEFERLKEFGIKAKKEGDNVSLTFQGVTTTIRNSAADITKYLENIGNVSFGGAMEERAKTLDGTIAALGDTWDELFRAVSSNNVGGLIFDSVTLANGVLEDATTIIRAMGGAVGETSREFGSLSAIQGGIATFFETVSVLAANTLYVLRQTGDTMAGVAAGYKAFFSFDFDAVRAIGAEMKANGEAARKEIDATTARILNARKAQEEYARYATRNASAATDPRRVDLGGSAPRATTTSASSGAGRGVKEAISEYDKLIKKLSDELPKAAAEAEAAQMGYNKAQTEFLALAGSPAWASFSNSQRAVVASMFEGKIASEEAGEAAKALSKSYAEAAAERLKTIQSMERAADSLQSQNDALRDEIELIGLSTEQQTLVLQQRNDVIILTKEATLAELERQSAITGTQTRVEIALASEIEALKERNALLGAKGVKNAAVDAAKSAADEWQKTSDKINDTLTDALMRGFESGKDFAKNLRDTVVNMFKTMVLRPVISAIINPISQGITGMMGLSGAAQAGQGASALGGIGNIASLASGIGSFTTAGMLPAGLATALTGSTSSLAMGLSGAWGAGGGMLSTLNAGASMLGSGSIMSGLGTLAGALGPIALGIAALAAIFGKKATPHAGAASTYSEAGGLVSGADIYRASGLADVRTYNAGVEQVTGNVAKAIGDTLNATARAFGKEAGYEISTAFADDTSKDGAWGSLMIRRDGESVIDWRDTQTSKWAPKEFADGEAGSKEYLAAVAKSARDALVGAIGDVDWATDMLTALGDSPTLEGLAQTVQQINAAQAAFDALGKNIVGFGALTDGAISQLVKAAGSIDGLVSAASTYYENFYSEAEKTANVTRDITAALADVGLQMPATRDEFRALVEAQMALGDAGTTAVAALLQVSGAFASVVPAAEAAAAAAVESVAVRRAEVQMLDVEPVVEAWRDMLASIVESTLAAQTELSRLGMTSYERALAEIQDNAQARLKELLGGGYMSDTIQTRDSNVRGLAGWEALKSRYAELEASGVLFRPGWESDIDATIAALKASIAALNEELAQMPPEIQELIDAETALLEARNALQAGEIVGNLQTEIERMGFTALERELAGISDRADDYVKSLKDLGQATEENIGAVGEWEDAMRQAAINRVDSQAVAITGGLQTEIDRLGMSDLERALAEIGDKADEYVKSLQDLDRATGANIGAVNDWEAAMRLDAIKKAWAGVTDSILGEIDRIRGSLSGDGGLAALQAEFAINTASARAGDTEAGGTLAKLSGDILRLSEGTAGSAFDWARMQAQMLASLQETARITSLMGGGMSPVSAASFVAPSQSNEISTPYMPPASQQGAGNAELIAEIRLLNQRLQTLEANTQATALHTQKTSKALERAMPGGDAIATREVAA